MLVSNGLKSFLSTLVQRLLSSRVARMAMKGSQWIEMVCHYPRLISLLPLYRIEFTSCTFLLSLIAETPQHSICSGPCILPIISGRSKNLEPQRESLSLHIPCAVNDWSAFGGIGCLPANSAYTKLQHRIWTIRAWHHDVAWDFGVLVQSNCGSFPCRRFAPTLRYMYVWIMCIKEC
jgi:hypothetical protein